MATASNHRVLLTCFDPDADASASASDVTSGRIWLYGRDDRPVSADATVTAPGGGAVPLGPGALVDEWANVAVNTDYSVNGNTVGSYVSASLWANVGTTASPADHVTVDGRDGSYYVAEVIYRPAASRPRSARFEFQVSATVDYQTNGDTVTVGANEVVLVSALDERIFGTGDVESFVASEIAAYFADLPTSDPAVAGQLWNDSTTVRVSAG